MNFEKTIAPGATVFADVKADYFCLVFSPVDLLVRFPGLEPDIYSQGDSIEFPKGETFTRVELKNPSLTATATVLFYAGFGRYVQRRQAVVEPPTEVVAWAPGTLAAATGVTFLGLPSGNLFRRKCIQVSNEDPNNSLHIRDGSGRVALVVFPQTSVTLPISGRVEVYNFLGVSIAVRISEIFWST